jgi:hypothetical protein
VEKWKSLWQTWGFLSWEKVYGRLEISCPVEKSMADYWGLVLWKKSLADYWGLVLWKKSLADCGNFLLWEKSG